MLNLESNASIQKQLLRPLDLALGKVAAECPRVCISLAHCFAEGPKLSDSGHEARRLEQRCDTAVRMAWLGRVVIFGVNIQT